MHEGELECAISVSNSQVELFHKGMGSRKYYPSPDSYAELGRSGVTKHDYN